MKIGLVRRGYSDTGGAERYLLRFTDGLEKRGHECVLFSDQRWPESAWADRQQVTLERTRSPIAFADALQSSHPREGRCDFLFSLERVRRCDCYRAGDGVHAAWLERRSRFEPGWRSAFRNLNPKHRQILQLEGGLYSPPSTTHIIANASFVKEEIQAHYDTPDDRLTVIPNGFDLSKPPPGDTRETIRTELGLAPGVVAFLFVGSGWERKGLRFAINAVESLVERGFPACLLVAGKDKHAPRARHAESIRFLGPLDSDRLSGLYEAADVFLLPTLYDPFSNASLEAAAHGLPIVTTNANGIAELFPDLAGTVIDPSALHDLADACESWMEAAPREAAHPRNREVAGRYSVARNVEATLACFDQLISSTAS